MTYTAFNRRKHRNVSLNIFPLPEMPVIEKLMAYQKRIGTYSKNAYHLNFYELILLYIVKGINSEEGQPGASLADCTHYMGWNIQKRGKYYIERMLEEGWLVNATVTAVRPGLKYDLFLSVKCSMALVDIAQHAKALIEAVPPKVRGKGVKKVVNSFPYQYVIDTRLKKEAAKLEEAAQLGFS